MSKHQREKSLEGLHPFLLTHILDQLPDRDVAALSQTNRASRDAAEQFFGTSIELSWTQKKNPRVVPLLLKTLSEPKFASRVRHIKLLGRDFYLTIENSSYTARNFPLNVPITPDEQKILMDAIEGLSLPFISSWAEKLRDGNVDALVALLLKSVPNIRSLRMESNFTREARFVGDLFRSALCDPPCPDLPSFHDLQDVVFHSQHTPYRRLYFPRGNADDVLPLFHLPAAQIVDLFIDTPPSGILNWPAKPPDLSNLTSLTLSMLREPSLEEVLSATPCLKSLRWVWQYGPSYKGLPWGQTINLDQVASALRHVQNTLESLHIEAWADYGGPSDIEYDPLETRGTLRPLANFAKLRNLTAPWTFVVGFTPDTSLRLEEVIPSSVESLVLEASLMYIDTWEWRDYEMVALFPSYFESRRADGQQLRKLEMLVPANGADCEWESISDARPRLAKTQKVSDTEVKRTFAAQFETKDLVTFDANKHYGDWRDEFHNNGCVVIKNFISPERAQYCCDKQIEWLKKFDLGFDDKDPSTWTADHLPISFKGGMYMAYGASHEKMVWKARMEPKIVEIFEKPWGTNELISSFDGMKISLPNRKDIIWSPWPHCDQNPERKGMQAVQGLLNFAPNGPKDGGLMLTRGSANLFDEFFAHERESADHEDAPPPDIKFMDLFLFSEKDVKWFESKGCGLFKVNMEPGDFVFWDSRTMHYARFPEGEQICHLQYICVTPRRFATEEALEAKKFCFENWIGTTHWPHCNIRPTEDKPKRNGKICPKYRAEPFEKPEITDKLLQLAGVKPC